MLERLLEILDEMILLCTEGEDCATLSKRCARQCLGIIHEQLHHAELPPRPKACEINISPAKLSDILSNILSEISSDLRNHCQCRILEWRPGLLPKCVFSQEGIDLNNEAAWNSLQKSVTNIFRQVFKVLASKVKEEVAATLKVKQEEGQ